MTFSIRDFFSKYDQIRSFLRVWSRLLKNFLMENFIFVYCLSRTGFRIFKKIDASCEGYAHFTKYAKTIVFHPILTRISVQSPYSLRTTKKIPLFWMKQEFFKTIFFPSRMIEWNNVDHSLRNSPSVSAFMESTYPSKVYTVHNTCRLKLLTMLRLGLSSLRAYKFNDNFSDYFDEFCIRGTNTESTK